MVREKVVKQVRKDSGGGEEVLASLRCKNNVVRSVVMVRSKKANTRMTTAMVTIVILVRE